MSRRLLATAFVSALVLLSPPAVAAKAPVVTATDPAGDVKVLGDDNGDIPAEQLRSIDLRALTVTIGSPGNETTRFAVEIARVTNSPKFDQMFFVTLSSPPGVKPAYRSDIGFAVQGRKLSYAYYTSDVAGDDLVVCDPLSAKVRRKLKVVFLDVPHSCIPEGPAKIRVLSATGVFRSEGPGYSRDKMKVVGSYVLK